MSITYTPTTNFGAKDSLPANDPAKVIKGADFSTEYTAIQSAFSLAAPASNPTFTGTASFADVDITNDLTVDTDTLVVNSTTDRVGINVPVPLYDLDINMGSARLGIASKDTGEIQLGAHQPAMPICFGSYSEATIFNEVMRVQGNTGNVGIGTDSPAAKAHIAGANETSSFTPNASADELLLTREGSNAGMTILSGATSNSNIYFGKAGAVTTSRITHSNDTNHLSLYTTNTPRLTLDDLGNVGIGTNDPKEKLHVVTATNGLATVADASADELVLENTGDVGMTFLSPNTATQTIAFGDTENRKVGWIEYDHTTNAATFGTGNSERMTIDDTGNVGIGTSNPSASLDVESEIHVNDPASANPLRLKQTGANAEVVNVAAGDIEIGLANDGDIYFVNGVAKNKRLTIDNLGRVGIGTDAPNSKVDITHAQSEGSYAHLEINGKNSNENTQIALIGAGTGVHKIVHNKDLLFGTATNPADTTSTVTDNVTFAANGNVGIGTDAPSEKLTLGSDSQTVGQYISLNNIATNYTASEWGGLLVESSDASGGGVGTKGSIRALSTGNTAGRVAWEFNVSNGTVNDYQAMFIDSDCNVALPGYGTSSMTLDVGTDGTSVNSILNLNQQQGKVTIEAGGILTNTDDTSGGNFEFVTTEAFGSTATAMTVKGTGALNLEPRASAPAAPAAGDLYFDSSTNKLRCYDGTTWQDCF